MAGLPEDRRQAMWRRPPGASIGQAVQATGDHVLRLRALTICRTSCPVRAQCQAWALRYAIEYGIFGGQTAKERNTLLRRSGRRRRVQPSHRRVSPTR